MSLRGVWPLFTPRNGKWVLYKRQLSSSCKAGRWNDSKKGKGGALNSCGDKVFIIVFVRVLLIKKLLGRTEMRTHERKE